MKTAIIAVTARGARLGQAIKDKLGLKADVYEKEGKESGGEAYHFSSMKELMEGLFHDYDRLLCIMATGIVVRMIAPYIKHKSQDPAIVVMDEGGQFAISLLSGHLGGANEWTHQLADLIGAQPVITTATDVNGYPAPDVLARHLHCKIDDFSILKIVNADIVAGKQVNYYIDSQLFNAEAYKGAVMEHAATFGKTQVGYFEASPQGITSLCESLEDQHLESAILITDKLLNPSLGKRILILRPPTVTVGIGCRRDTPKEFILEAVLSSLKKEKLSPLSVMSAASVIVKADEVGLLAAMEKLKWPIKFFTQEEMAPCIESQELEESNFVKQTIGVGNVCETTALLMAKSQTLIQNKTIYPKTTVAIAQVQLRLSVLDQVMKNL